MNNLIKKLFNRETISYVIFGVLTTVVDYVAAYAFFYRIGLEEITSNTIAWVLSVIFAYITNKIFVFESKEKDIKVLSREIVTFAGARVITLIISDVFLAFAKMINLEFLVAKLLISVVVVILNYFFSKLFIFKKSPEHTDTIINENGGHNE